MFLKTEGSWLYSTRLLKLRRLGVEQPLLFVLRAWQYALNEARDTCPTLTDEQLDMMEETVKWDGDDGALVDALRATGFLDGNTFELWWEDGAEPIAEKRRKGRARQAKSRKSKGDVTPKKRGVTPKPKGVTPSAAPVTPPEALPPTEGSPNTPVSTPSKGSKPEKRVTRKQRGVTPKTTPVTPEGALQAEQSREDKIFSTEKGGLNDPSLPATWIDVRDAWVDQWSQREVETSRKMRFKDRGFFGDRGPYALRHRLDQFYKRGPAEAVEQGVASFWSWWDTDGRRVKGNGWRPSPANITDDLEKWLVSQGMHSKVDYLASLGMPKT